MGMNDLNYLPNYANPYGGGKDLWSLLAGGAAGGPWGLLAGAGLKGLGGLLGMFGRSGARSDFKKSRNAIKGEIGKDIYDPAQIAMRSRQAKLSQANKQGGRIDSILGLDTGKGQAALYEKPNEEYGQDLLNLLLSHSVQKKQRDDNLRNILLQSDYSRAYG